MSQLQTRIIISGYGKMGQEVERTFASDPNYFIHAVVDSSEDLAQALKQYGADIVIDFSTPTSSYPNAKMIIEYHVHPVIGTTGMAESDIKQLQEACQSRKLGGIIAPNFSIGAVLMMQFAANAAKFLPDACIIEKHHTAKLDAPSGTAIKTAQMMAQQRPAAQAAKTSHEAIAGVLGGQYKHIPIHAIRLPGYLANQEVIFSESGETLSLTHNTISRAAYMPGLKLACAKVKQIHELVYGLENILF